LPALKRGFTLTASCMETDAMNRTVTTQEILIILAPSIALAIVAIVAALVIELIDRRRR
jgi:hypothetical protein